MKRRGTSSDRPLIVSLNAGRVEVLGEAENLRFVVKGHRQLASGRYEHLQVEIRACRYSVKRLLEQLAGMHARDRERIRRELARIERETRVLTEPPPAA